MEHGVVCVTILMDSECMERDRKVTLFFGDYLEVSYKTNNNNLKETQYYYAEPYLVAKATTGTYCIHQGPLRFHTHDDPEKWYSGGKV